MQEPKKFLKKEDVNFFRGKIKREKLRLTGGPTHVPPFGTGSPLIAEPMHLRTYENQDGIEQNIIYLPELEWEPDKVCY